MSDLEEKKENWNVVMKWIKQNKCGNTCCPSNYHNICLDIDGIWQGTRVRKEDAEVIPYHCKDWITIKY